jgi:hypothetical protein
MFEQPLTPQKPAHREASAAPHVLVELIAALGIAAALIVAWPYYRDWAAADILLELSERERASILAGCPLPAESEQMHIVVKQRGERLVAQCMHVSSRGTYNRTRKGMP